MWHDTCSQVIKSKSEISALTDFLSWIEAAKENADGVILVYHEPRKVIPAMLLESLKKYDLVDRFKKTVKGFANGFNIAEEKCANSAHIYSLRTLSRTLLKKVKRAILYTYESKGPKRDDISLIRILALFAILRIIFESITRLNYNVYSGSRRSFVKIVWI